MAASFISILLLSIFFILAVTQGRLHSQHNHQWRQISHQSNSVLPQFGSSDLVILDSSRSTFYTISFPSPQEPVIKKLAGNGAAGYADGELGSALFNKPKSFVVDFKGNVYVADKHTHIIRKITKSGGISQVVGHRDGLAQNASFSDDFELAFIPERCALMISDHGNRLVRQINLKAEDCTHGSQSGMRMASAWATLGLALSCIVSLVIGFVSRPYVISRTGRIETSTLQQDMKTLPNQSGETSTDALLRRQKRSC